MISLLKLFGVGVFIGIANVVPGVSGGTIAVICNVYDKLIILSSLNLRRIKGAWQDILSLALGIGAGIVLFAKVITLLYRAYPVQTSAFFIGVVAGSIPVLFRCSSCRGWFPEIWMAVWDTMLRCCRFCADAGNVFLTASRYTDCCRCYRLFTDICGKISGNGSFGCGCDVGSGYFRLVCVVDSRRISDSTASSRGA